MTGHDVASTLLELDGLRLLSTEEHHDTLVHRMGRDGRADLLIGGPLDPDDAPSSQGCWLGVEVGTYPATTPVLDTLLTAQDAGFTGFDRLRGALSGDGLVTLWWTEDFRPEDLSLASTRAIAHRADEGARHVREAMDGPRRREPTGTDNRSLEWADRAGDRALRRGGHSRWTFRAETFVGPYRWADGIDPRGDGPHVDVRDAFVQVGEGPWSVRTSVTGDDAVMWLEGRWPPDCIRLETGAGKVVVAGGLGLVAFALEDRHDLTRGFERALSIRDEPTFLDVALHALAKYSKLDVPVRPVMPKGLFGWQRPFTIVASTVTREARVRVLVPDRGELEDDGALSVAMTDLVRAGGHGSAEVLERFRDRFAGLDQALTRRPERG
ncbi:hypothetical protein [Georgenia muralis]|uniref:Uncharacterized protein n=1 Tax=Georgenia muralis TaxID=154117 RepID=A0A3N4ZUE2_9MICO|nr:hypothetical protein [Georgenia muralis]RPF29048.1 hypothetical protein EDD32_3603 [Georgenia muralis]